MVHPPFSVTMPEHWQAPVIVASPHSGRHYPEPFMARTVLDGRVVRSSEDAFVDRLVADAPRHGAPLLAALYPRAYLDLNRGPDELDPGVVEGVRFPTQNARIASGLGVIPRVVANGRAIYRGKLTRTEAEARIEEIWRPYHAQLAELVTCAKQQFGRSILLDFHSMPHEALDTVARTGAKRPEVVLGDLFGAAAGAEIVDELEAAFAESGLQVSRNAPFAGAHIIQTYGRPKAASHAVQIEIDRSLYMDEKTIRPNGDFEALTEVISAVLHRMISVFGRQMPLAAE